MKTREPFGTKRLTLVDRFGMHLSLQAIKRFLPKHPLDILELGCGYEAKLLRALQPKIKSAVGIDYRINPSINNMPPFSYIEAPIEQAVHQLEARSFDVIMLISVLEHLHEPTTVLAQCHQLLKSNGVFLINVPTWRGKTFLEFSAFKLGTSPKAEMDDHKMYYDKRDLWPLLVKAGFLPSQLKLHYHKFGLNLFAVAKK